MLKKINETVSHIKERLDFAPQVGIILGTGLGGLVKEININYALDFDTIPNFPVSTVEGHNGRLIFGTLGGKKVVAMQGRFHYYEGYSMEQVTFPVRVMKFLGVKSLVVSNASGGVNPEFEIGDIMLINDHLNMFPDHPLRGHNDSLLGPRFPDMSDTYSALYIKKAYKIAQRLGIKLQQGVYAGVSGPTFETPAEYSYFRAIGADTVGMSTVPEVIVAKHMGIPVFGVSIITDLGVPGKIVEVTHEDVQQVARRAELKMTQIITELVKEL